MERPDAVAVLLLVLAVAAPGGSAGAVSSVEAGDQVSALVEAFSREFRGRKAEKSFAELSAGLDQAVPSRFAEYATGDAQWRLSLAAAERLGDALAAARDPRARTTRKTSSASKHSSNTRARSATAVVFPAPREVEYRFGLRELAAGPEASSELAALLGKRKVPSVDDLGTTVRLEYLLRGVPAELELARATLLAELDVWRGGDEFGAFLERWRNSGPEGDESFYDALDRAAGTREEVFYFDAMLDDFAATFGGSDGKRWTRAQSQEHLHRAFLALRQYRNVVRTIADWALVPAAVSLPEDLRDYDHSRVPRSYCVRDELDVIAAARGGDVEGVLEEMRSFLGSRTDPEALWEGLPIASELQEYLGARLQEVSRITGRGSDELLAERLARSNGEAAVVAGCAHELLGVLLGTG